MGFSRNELVEPEAISASLTCHLCKQVLNDPVYWGQLCQHVFCRACVEAQERREKAKRTEARAAEARRSEAEAAKCVDEDWQAAQESDGGPADVADICVDDGRAKDPDSDEEVGVTEAELAGFCPTCGAAVGKENLRSHQVLQSLVGKLQVLCERRCGWVGRFDARTVHTAVCPLVALEAVRSQTLGCDQQIAELEAERAARAKLLEDEQLLERDARIAELEAGIEQRDGKLIELGRQLVEREVRLADFEERLAEQDIYVTAACAARFDDVDATRPPLPPVALVTVQTPSGAGRPPPPWRGSSLADVIAGTDLDM